MRSSSRNRALAVALGSFAVSAQAEAQKEAPGFGVERFSPSPAGAGWLVMDNLDIRGALGGAMGLTIGYAHDPLRVTDGVNHLAVVSDQAFINFGAAVTYDRWRFYLDFASPFVSKGASGMVAGYTFTGPSVDPGTNPDPLSDVRIGSDVRIVGEPEGPARAGIGAQFFFPSGNRSDYTTDYKFRGVVRALMAGDVRPFSYASQIGVHIRPVDDGPVPESPRGSELLFGLAAGPKFSVGPTRDWAIVIGPELYGATAFRTFLGSSTTALEGLLSARIEGGRAREPKTRVRLGIGAGIVPHFGAPEWRVVVGIEMFRNDR